MAIQMCNCMGQASREESRYVTGIFLFVTFGIFKILYLYILHKKRYIYIKNIGWVAFITVGAMYIDGLLPNAIPIQVYIPVIVW